MTADDLMHAIDAQLSHVWMVRTFLKHSEEAEEDDELREVHRELYDAMHALGEPLRAGDSAAYFKQLEKKLGKLRAAAVQFRELQPEVSGHMNFQMAAHSLTAAVSRIDELLFSGSLYAKGVTDLSPRVSGPAAPPGVTNPTNP